MVTIESILEAQRTFGFIFPKTPLNYSHTLSSLLGKAVWLKLENLQRTGSFKIRGAYTRIARLSEDERKRGVVAASAGNHAQGVALGAKMANVPAVVVMPETAPLSKVEAVIGYGAELHLKGKDYYEAEQYARILEKERNLVFVHAFNDDDVISGQGTLGLEILDDLPDVDTVVTGVGGGGLISGMAVSMKSRNPDIRIVGVEPMGAANMHAAWEAGRLITLESVATVADGLATRCSSERTFELTKRFVDDLVTVSDDEIATAILFLLERCKTVVEGAGAAGLAALLSGKIKNLGEKIVVVLTGGNIDVTMIDTIIKRGLLRSGRTLSFSTVITDKPGALRDLLSVLAEKRANIEIVEHERASLSFSLHEVQVQVKVGTRGEDHIKEIIEALETLGYVLSF